MRKKEKRWIPDRIELIKTEKIYPHATLWHTKTKMKKVKLGLIPDRFDLIEQVVHELSEITIFMVALPIVCKENRLPFKEAAVLVNPDLSKKFPKTAVIKGCDITFIDLMLVPEWMVEELENEYNN